MAKGKKSSGKNYISKGERPNVSRWLRKTMRREYLENNLLERANNQIAAFIKGKNVVLTIPNPNKNEKNKKFIRVNAREVWKTGSYSMKSTG
jgi:hypothetical protein